MLNVVSVLQPSVDAERAVSVGGSRTTAVAGGRGSWWFLGIIRVGGIGVPGRSRRIARFRAVLPRETWEFYGIRRFRR